MTRFVACAAAVLATSVAGAQPAARAAASAPIVDLVALLPPPPRPESAEQGRDLQAVLDVQHSRTPEQVARALADVQLSAFRFADVLGPRFTADSLPTTAAFIATATRAVSTAVNAAKEAWGRPRPYDVSPSVEPAIPRVANGAYPSGHSAYGMVCAILPARMVPEKGAELFARGREFGENRVVGGVHYPTDVEAGRTAAAVVVALLARDSTFNAGMTAARTELRAQLGLGP